LGNFIDFSISIGDNKVGICDAHNDNREEYENFEQSGILPISTAYIKVLISNLN
jgi:hypothetical protein